MTVIDYIRERPESSAALSKATGLSRSAISRIRRGKADAPLSSLEKVVTALGGKIVVVPDEAAA